MALQADADLDLVSVTQRELGPNAWTDISYDLQEYVALPQLLKKEKVSFESGEQIQWNVMTQTSGAAHMTGLFATDNVNVGDVMKQAYIPWRHLTTNYAIEDREIAINRKPARIVELVKIRRADAMIDLAKLLEAQFWSKPVDSTDTEDLFGVTYWIVSNASAGFNGGNPSGFTAGAANLSSATYTGWANWTDRYLAVTKDDLIRKMRLAAYKTNFRSPFTTPSYNTGNRYGYYTNYDVVSTMEEMLEDQNENLGNDVASKDGMVLFKKNPVIAVPHLDSNASQASTDPVYGINWGVFKPVFLSGEYMKELGPYRLEETQHRTLVTHNDTTINMKCSDRRRLFVIDKA